MRAQPACVPRGLFIVHKWSTVAVCYLSYSNKFPQCLMTGVDVLREYPERTCILYRRSERRKFY
jgi:hypothetical protein